ncbi:MAG: hypothetical protein E6J43_05160 [Chloroflexi bacterium]|nr:MAG: hypothetical protein E6J43_05160 [Chloroflexota bacterium]
MSPAITALDVTPRVPREESFDGPTIAEDLVMLLDLYRDLLALAFWRRISARFPKEALQLNSSI